jgi:cell wall-associated NlpC family hydrolase
VTTPPIGALQQIQTQLDQLAPPRKSAASGSVDLFARLISAMTAQDSASAAATTGATGSSIVDAAAKYEGVPYVLGGTTKSGIDCSGLVQSSLADVGIKVGRLVHEQATAGTAVPSLAQAKPGDLIVLDHGEHIVIYAGNGNVIHAPYAGRSVTLQKAWFTDADVVTIRRVAPDSSSAMGVAPTAAATAATTVAQSTAEALQSLIAAQTAMLAGSIS